MDYNRDSEFQTQWSALSLEILYHLSDGSFSNKDKNVYRYAVRVEKRDRERKERKNFFFNLRYSVRDPFTVLQKEDRKGEPSVSLHKNIIVVEILRI